MLWRSDICDDQSEIKDGQSEVCDEQRNLCSCKNAFCHGSLYPPVHWHTTTGASPFTTKRPHKPGVMQVCHHFAPQNGPQGCTGTLIDRVVTTWFMPTCSGLSLWNFPPPLMILRVSWVGVLLRLLSLFTEDLSSCVQLLFFSLSLCRHHAKMTSLPADTCAMAEADILTTLTTNAAKPEITTPNQPADRFLEPLLQAQGSLRPDAHGSEVACCDTLASDAASLLSTETSHQQAMSTIATPSSSSRNEATTVKAAHTMDHNMLLPDKRWQGEVGHQVEIGEADVEPMTQETKACFVFNVCNPIKKVDKKILDHVFYTYNVQTKTTLPQYSHARMNVERRYNDFLWLRETLSRENDGVIIPPLPPKHLPVEKAIDTDMSSLLKTREKMLCRFLTAVGAHPILQLSSTFQSFLELPAAQWTAWQQSREQGRVGTGTAPSKWDQLVLELQDAMRSLRKPAEPQLGELVVVDFSTGQAKYNKSNIAGHKKHVEELLRDLKDLRKKMEHWARHVKEEEVLYKDCTLLLGQLGKVERFRGDTELGKLVLAVAADLSSCTLQPSGENVLEPDLEHLKGLLDWCIWETTAAAEAVAEYTRQERELDQHRTELEQKQARHEKLTAPSTIHSQLGSEMEQRLQQEICRLQEKLSWMQTRIKNTASTLFKEMDHFHQGTSDHFVEVLDRFVNLVVHHHSHVLSMWDLKSSEALHEDP